MRNNGDHQFVFLFIQILGAEQAADHGNAGQPGNTGGRPAVGVLDDPADQIDLTIVQPDIGDRVVLADFGDVDATQILIIIDLRNIEVHVKRNLVILVHTRQYLQFTPTSR